MVNVVGGRQNFALVYVVYVERFEYARLRGVADAALRHDGDAHGALDFLNHPRVAHARDAARGAYVRERKFFGKGDLFRIFPRRERGGAAEEIESRARKQFQPLFAAERYGEGTLGIDSFKSRKVYARNIRVGTESRQIQVFMPGIIL